MSLDFVDNNKITIFISDVDFDISLLRKMNPDINIIVRIDDDDLHKLKKKIS